MGWASVVVAVSMLTIGLSGCVEDVPVDPIDNEAEVAKTPLALPWGMEKCKLAVALIDAPIAKVQPHVPEGFTVMSAAQVVAEEGGAPVSPANPSNVGNLGIEMFTCDAGVGLNGTVPDLIYGSLFTAVIPPPAMRVAGAKHHFVKWDVLIPDADRRAVLLEAGVPAKDGKASFSSYEAVGAGFQFEGSMTLGNETYMFSGAGAIPAEDGSFVEFTKTADGFVFWYTKYLSVPTVVGPIDVVVPATGLAAEILGPGLKHGAGFQGIVTFSEGKITDTLPK